jgi:hypothetical protein
MSHFHYILIGELYNDLLRFFGVCELYIASFLQKNAYGTIFFNENQN